MSCRNEHLLRGKGPSLRVSRRKWERSYVAAVIAIDAAAALVAATTAYVVRFGGDPLPATPVGLHRPKREPAGALARRDVGRTGL